MKRNFKALLVVLIFSMFLPLRQLASEQVVRGNNQPTNPVSTKLIEVEYKYVGSNDYTTNISNQQLESIKLRSVNETIINNITVNLKIDNSWSREYNINSEAPITGNINGIKINCNDESISGTYCYYDLELVASTPIDIYQSVEVEAPIVGFSFDVSVAQPSAEPTPQQPNDEVDQQPTLSGALHTQYVGWEDCQAPSFGTPARGYRVEGIKLNLSDNVKGSIKYQAHVQWEGWQAPVKDGALAGTTGLSYRMEAIRISLEGEVANQYDVVYRTHTQGYGWLGWAKNGEDAGTTGLEYQINGLEIKLVPKGTNIDQSRRAHLTTIDGIYQPHVQYNAWMQPVGNEATIGTTGNAYRLEALKLSLKDSGLQGGIEYNLHLQDIGWQGAKDDGQVAGTTGEERRAEAVCIALYGEIAKYYDIYYQAHIQEYGWLGWAKNGEIAGSYGISYRMEAVWIKIVPKGTYLDQSRPSYQNKPIDSFYNYGPVYYSQRDHRWAKNWYGSWQMGPTGCVPTTIAMALSGMIGYNVYPNQVADHLWRHTYEFNWYNMGASGLAFKLGAEAWGASTNGIDSLAELNDELYHGKLVMAMVDSRSPFCNSGTHAILLYNYQPGGYVSVYDPYNAYNNGVYNTSSLWNDWRSHDPYDLRGGYAFYSTWI